MRKDGRPLGGLRAVQITPDYLPHAEGSALIEIGDTRVLCTVSVENRTPPFLRGTGTGWVTAEYGMLPRSTSERMSREHIRNSGRTHEIQRLIGRSLRSVTDLSIFGERTFAVDCDVIRADGGTRTAAITGAYVALWQAFDKLMTKQEIDAHPLREAVAAVSVGIVDGAPMLDLCYEEDSQAEVDFNVVMTESGLLVEVQGTAEGKPFSRAKMDELIDLAADGIGELLKFQRLALERLSVA